jgi:hypothetical protein
MTVAENKPLVPIVRHDDARHDSAEARPGRRKLKRDE